jgi:glycosyltransferase involved in cell wall biosynthesis
VGLQRATYLGWRFVSLAERYNVTDAAVFNRDSGKKRIAWVTFDFPPRQSSGVFRAIKFYKYLDKNRFEVDFITHGPAGRFARAVLDDSLLAEVGPAPAIYRVPTIIPHDVLPAVASRLRGARRSATAEAPRSASVAPRPKPQTRSGVGRTLYRWFALSLYFPDHLFIWGWLAALKVARLHLQRRYDIVYTTSYPESAHLAGLLLRALGVRWIVDYRYGGPLWIKEVVGFPKSSLRQRIDHAYQGWVLRRADQVITQSERIRADFCRAFALRPERVEVLPSGYDEADFAAPAAAPAFTKQEREIHLLHVGAFEGLADRERLQVLDALNVLGGRLRERGRTLVLHAVGSDLFSQAEQRRAVHVEYRHHGVVVHRHVPAYLQAADCCLLSTWTTTNGGVKGFIPSKLWEYLRSGVPILTTGPKDEVWSIVEDAGVGLHLPLGDDRPADAALLAGELIDHVGATRPLAGTVKKYSWESRAQLLQALLLRMVEGPRPASC